MSISVVVIIVGAAFLAIGLIGGGIKIGVKEGEASIPPLNRTARVLAFIIGICFILFGVWLELYRQASIAPATTSTSISSQNRIDAISGTWVGKAKNGDFEFDAKFTIGKSCQIGSVCGTFDFPTISCSGTITITKIDGTLFISQPNDRTSGCFTNPDIQESLQLLPDGTLLYTSKSNSYGETNAILTREK